MITPLKNVNITNMPTTLLQDCNWFDKKDLSSKKLVLINTNDQLYALLKTTHANWSRGIERSTGIYRDLVEYSHNQSKYLQPKDTTVQRVLDANYTALSQNFNFTIYDDSNLKTPIGFVAGNYMASSSYDIQLGDNMQSVFLKCTIDAVEIAPEYWNRGAGNSIQAVIVNSYSTFVKSILSQLDQEILDNMTFESMVESEMDSHSGIRWATKLNQKIEKETLSLLIRHNVSIDNIGSSYLDGSI